jgi:Tubulin-tyrosine ligase family
VKIINRNGVLRDLESHPKSGNLPSNTPEKSKNKNEYKIRDKSASDSNSWERSVWPEIKRKIICTLEAAQTATTHREKSFEFLGYDVLVDEEGVPWILEVKRNFLTF